MLSNARRRARTLLVPALVAVTAAAVLSGAAIGSTPASTARVAVADDGSQPDRDIFSQASMTPDARFVVFASDSTTLAPGAIGATGFLVYVRDRLLGTTELVSRGIGGTAPNGNSVNGFGAPAISADGRYVAFASLASNLVTGDTDGTTDVFVFDRTTGTTLQASSAVAGGQPNGPSSNPSISADGHVVVFQSQASNLVEGDTNATTDVFAYDIASGTVIRASLGVNGVQANGPSTVTSGAVSSDGRFVAFTSTAANLVLADQNGPGSDVFVRELKANVTELASLTDAGVQSTADTANAFISGDARYVAFQCTVGCSLVPGSQRATAIFVRDRTAGTVKEASVSSTGEEAGSSTFIGGFSADGKHVAFASNASNLSTVSPYGAFDLYVRDVDQATTERVSVSSAGDLANDSSITAGQILSADGRFVLVSSTATNLVTGDTNGRRDLFIRDRGVAGPPPSNDQTPPAIACADPDGAWHPVNVTLACTASDTGSGLADPADASFALATSVAPDASSGSAVTNSHTVCDVAGNCATGGPIAGNRVDRQRPSIACDPVSPGWHRNVLVSCSASDTGSGVAAADESFGLATHVPDGTVDPIASTDTRLVCDAVGNCSDAGPLTEIKVDLVDPTYSCPPADDAWHPTSVTLDCTSADVGSGLADSADATFTLTAFPHDGVEESMSTDAHVICDGAGNCVTARVDGVKVDTRDPVFSCADPDTEWHADNVSLACTGYDGGSGLDAQDEHFALSTEVPDNTETAQAATGYRFICDHVDHCVHAGPIGPVRIDRKRPVVGSPTYSGQGAHGWLNEPVTVTWACDDGGSGPVTHAVSVTVSSEGGGQHPTAICSDKVGHTTVATSPNAINIDLTRPTVSAPFVVLNPMPVGSPIPVLATAVDALSGLWGGEWFVGPDPGEGKAQPMTRVGLGIGAQLSSVGVGIHTLCIRSVDAAGNWSVPRCTTLVVYQPSGAISAGATWPSPPGTYRASPTLGGTGRISLAISYPPGAVRPTGQLRFLLNEAHVDFRATSFDWLVVTGSRAQARGVGTLNGVAYQFLLTAVDGGTGGVDRLRFKIWAAGSGTYVYDTNPGEPDDADPTQIISGVLAVSH